MRILYDFQAFQIQQFGGISRYIVEISSRIAAAGWAEVYIFKGLHRSSLRWKPMGSSTQRSIGFRIGPVLSGLKPTSLINYAWFGLFQGVAEKFDILHFTYYPRSLVNRKGARIVVSLYDMIPETFPSLYKGDPIIDRRRKAFQAADLILSISESSRRDLLRFYQIDPGKIKVVHLASSLLPDQNKAITAVNKSGALSGKPFILYVGVRAGYKNFSAVLNAFGTDPLLYQNFDLCCFGSAPFSMDENHQIKNLRLRGRVRILKGSDDFLRECYKEASALVYPSLFEGFGLPLVEAMALGCPVAASDRGSVPEVLAGAGILFDPTHVEDIARALKVILFDEDARKACILKGLERSRSFSWENTAEQTLAAYSKCLQSY